MLSQSLISPALAEPVLLRWPLGMPLVRKIEVDLWEVRSRLEKGRMSRLFFTVHGDKIILLHGFIK